LRGPSKPWQDDFSAADGALFIHRCLAKESSMMSRFNNQLLSLACGLALAASANLALADPAGLAYDKKPYRFATPEQASAGNGGVIASHVVESADADWLRLNFTDVQLQPGSKIRITSMLDGAQQHLNAETIQQWRHTSAYFNGSAVRVELIAAPGSVGNRFGIKSLMAGKTMPQTESQCGAVDNRVASSADNRGRLLDVGCTANLMAPGCFTTAGHCMSTASLLDVVEFQVPPSTSGGALRHPAPSDQYVPTSNREFRDGGVGNDWGVFTVFANTETGLTPLQAQGPGLDLATSLPAKGSTVEITGYGVDSGSANQTQQVSTGPIKKVITSSTRLTYKSDTEGGNSGSAVLSGANMVAIHTNGGCSTSGTGSNSGTLYTNSAFQAAYGRVCGVNR
jgi:V8-like Glu-specific endopeptidase